MWDICSVCGDLCMLNSYVGHVIASAKVSRSLFMDKLNVVTS